MLFLYRMLWLAPDEPPARVPAAPPIPNQVDRDKYRQVVGENKQLKQVIAALQAKGYLEPQADGGYNIIEPKNDWKQRYEELDTRSKAEMALVAAGLNHPEDRSIVIDQYTASKSKEPFDTWLANTKKAVDEGKGSRLLTTLLSAAAPTQPVDPKAAPKAAPKPAVAPVAPKQAAPPVDAGNAQPPEAKPVPTPDEIMAMDLDTFRANKEVINKNLSTIVGVR